MTRRSLRRPARVFRAGEVVISADTQDRPGVGDGDTEVIALRKAVALLREEGLVVTVKGRGSYVKPSR